MTPPYMTDGLTAVVGAIIVCVGLLWALAWSLCRAAADGDCALAGPLDEDAETFDMHVAAALAVIAESTPIHDDLRAHFDRAEETAAREADALVAEAYRAIEEAS